jgi:hypothetical protein
MTSEMSDLISEYISLAISHGESTLSGDFKNGNKAYRKMEKIVEAIRNSDEMIRKQFYILMYHENDNVKTWTASYLLGTYENEALEALTKIARNSKNIFSFNAEMTIKEWKLGNLKSIENWNEIR